MSGWNFDVAALKRSANDEGPGLERLSTIAETPGMLTPLLHMSWAFLDISSRLFALPYPAIQSKAMSQIDLCQLSMSLAFADS